MFRKSVHNVVEKGVERAVEIGSLFEAAAGILAEPVESVLAKLEGREVALQDYASLIGRFQSAAAAAANASHNEVSFRLLLSLSVVPPWTTSCICRVCLPGIWQRSCLFHV
jgi:hypothetical protein